MGGRPSYVFVEVAILLFAFRVFAASEKERVAAFLCSAHCQEMEVFLPGLSYDQGVSMSRAVLCCHSFGPIGHELDRCSGLELGGLSYSGNNVPHVAFGFGLLLPSADDVPAMIGITVLC